METKKLTGSQVLTEKISLGGCEEKQSGRHRYLKTQVIYDEKPFLLKVAGTSFLARVACHCRASRGRDTR